MATTTLGATALTPVAPRTTLVRQAPSTVILFVATAIVALHACELLGVITCQLQDCRRAACRGTGDPNDACELYNPSNAFPDLWDSFNDGKLPLVQQEMQTGKWYPCKCFSRCDNGDVGIMEQMICVDVSSSQCQYFGLVNYFLCTPDGG